MIKVCPECRATCMGGRQCARCGARLTDVADRTRREDVAGVGISIRALYAARAAMVLFCAGFLFGAMFGLMFVRRAFGAHSTTERLGWYAIAALVFAGVWWGMAKVGKLHYDRTLAANRVQTGLTGAEHDFFPEGYDHST